GSGGGGGGGKRGIAQRGTAALMGGLWRLFHNQSDASPHAFASPVPCPRDTEVDARRDAASGEAIAVDADAFAAGLCAELGERLASTPVHRSTVSSQQAGSSEQQRAGAHAADPPRP